VQAAGWEAMKDFVQSLTDKTEVDDEAVRVALVPYSSRANPISFTNITQNNSAVYDAVEGLKFTGGGTNTPEALESSKQIFLAESKNETVKKIIIITDGFGGCADNQECYVATYLKEVMGVEIIVVGVGDAVNKFELQFMASDPDHEHIFNTDFSSMQEISERLMDATFNCTDTVPPEVVLGSQAPPVLVFRAFNVTATFTEPVRGFTEKSIQTFNAIADRPIRDDVVGLRYVIPVAVVKSGVAALQIPAGAVTDPSGNRNKESNQVTVLYRPPAGCEFCSEHANCVGYNGGKRCECKTGFRGNGQECEDIDECIETSPCPWYSCCYNRPGTYECKQRVLQRFLYVCPPDGEGETVQPPSASTSPPPPPSKGNDDDRRRKRK